MPAHSKQYLQPRANIPRPPLPIEHINPNIRTIDTSKPVPVKFQEISRDGQVTVVGRVKIQTPTGHAFILRRLDTGAVSLTTMFRAAFPTASEEAEKAEASWVKSSYDVSGANKSGKARFAGTWVSADVALVLADAYHILPIIVPLTQAVPDPNTVYRKSGKTQQQPTPATSPAAHPPAPVPIVVPSPTQVTAPPAKRRREASPAHPITIPPPISTLQRPVDVTSPAKPISAAAPVPPSTPVAASPVSSRRRGSTPTSPRTRAPTSPATRRSARLKSPAPSAATFVPTPRMPKTTKAIREEATTPGGLDATAVDEEAYQVAKVTEVNMIEDVREQKELIERLKAEREAKAQRQEQEAAKVGDVDHPMDTGVEESASSAQKRAREEENVTYTLNIKEPEVEERQIATNRRVTKLMNPERKSLAWGALFFAAGVGAISLIPSLPSIF